MNIHLITAGLLGGLYLAGNAQAEIYKNIDANGHVTYSNMPSRGATRLDLGEPSSHRNLDNTPKPLRTKMATPADFPRVDKSTQNRRDDKRRQILLSELETEQKALGEAKKAHSEHEQTFESLKNSTQKNPAELNKAQEKSRILQSDVDTHQSNIELLQKELANLR